MSFSYNKTYQNDKFHRIHEMGMRLLLLVCRIRPHVVFPVASSNTLLALGVVAELSLPPSLQLTTVADAPDGDDDTVLVVMFRSCVCVRLYRA